MPQNGLLMMALQDLCQWVNDWPAAVALRESEDVYPLIETVHVLAIALIVGTVIAVDLRLLGVIFRKEPVTRIARALLPFTWSGFGVMLITGLPLFAAEAAKLYANPAFRLKLLLLALAGSNALLFHLTTYRSIDTWVDRQTTPVRARAFASISILLWSGIIVSGRLIAVFRAH
jgi:hypothetical protein